MAHGIPLTDEDRWGWLKKIAALTYDAVNLPSQKCAFVGCSSLKKVYRDLIVSEVDKKNHANGTKVKVIFIFLNISIEQSRIRVGKRKNHYMKPNMVDSQFDIMEVPRASEVIIGEEEKIGAINHEGNSLVIDPNVKNNQQIVSEIVNKLQALGIQS